uniref:Uncharacterized protein n=1 Tax=Salix viminalis TaxID=40686 RepID=A0A6N2KQL8_SALVM
MLWSEVTKVKREEPQDDDFDEPIKERARIEEWTYLIDGYGFVLFCGLVRDKGNEQEESKKSGREYDAKGRDPLRIFYETLFEQIPDSEMAQFWSYEKIVDYSRIALLVSIEANEKQVYRSSHIYLQPKRRQQSPKYCLSTKTKATDSKVTYKQSKKRKAEGESAEDDFLITKKNTKKQKTS